MKSIVENHYPTWRRLLWMVAIWGMSVFSLAIVASLFKLLMHAAGMKVA